MAPITRTMMDEWAADKGALKRYIDQKLTEVLAEKMRPYWEEWEDQIINGDGSEPKHDFSEIRAMMNSTMIIHAPIRQFSKIRPAPRQQNEEGQGEQ